MCNIILLIVIGEEMIKVRKFFKNYGLSIVLLALFIVTWALQFFAQFIKVKNSLESSGKDFSWAIFFPEFFSATFENWQSEFLQLLTFVFLTAFLIHKNSAESRDGTDRIERKVDKILKALEK